MDPGSKNGSPGRVPAIHVHQRGPRLRIGKIISSRTHADYICQIDKPFETERPPLPADYAFGQFVRLANASVGVIYGSLLQNPNVSMMGGRLSSSPRETQIFTPEGKAVPVTVIEVGPCSIVQRKTVEKDGYEAVQLGYLERKEARKETKVARGDSGHRGRGEANKPTRGHFEKNGGATPTRHLAEFRLIADGDEILHAPGSADPLNTVTALYGKDLARELLPVSYSRPGLAVEGWPMTGVLLSEPASGRTAADVLADNSKAVVSRAASNRYK